ncbi:DUF7344 domain-containing protein [Natronosalvus halobius]|uniref:DUF7344 domain-containing protein n=1 Tax=Natronosalvus halobius TaxID=2953746 RepID=UPI00209C7C74|nr:hypothetical protein [Natronosalvus halobius]USZ73526.1 hypothetical protein NGM15_17840 [Natronosalvus halobius]
MSLDALAITLGQGSHESEEHIAVQLRHSTLPRLSESGLIEYDARSQTIRYWGNPMVEEVLETISEFPTQHVEI